MMHKKAHDAFVKEYLKTHAFQLERLIGVNYKFYNGVTCSLAGAGRDWLLVFSEEAARVAEGTFPLLVLRKFSREQLSELGKHMNSCDRSYAAWKLAVKGTDPDLVTPFRRLLAETAATGCYSYRALQNTEVARLFFALYPAGKPATAAAQDASEACILAALRKVPDLARYMNLIQPEHDLLTLLTSEQPDATELRRRFIAIAHFMDSDRYAYRGSLFYLLVR